MSERERKVVGGSMLMEGGPATAAIPLRSTATVAPPRYSLPPCRFYGEDVLFCVDVDVESKAEMAKGRAITRLDAIKQALLLFVHTKLSMNPDHRFAFSILAQSVSWVRPFSPPPTLPFSPFSLFG